MLNAEQLHTLRTATVDDTAFAEVVQLIALLLAQQHAQSAVSGHGVPLNFAALLEQAGYLVAAYNSDLHSTYVSAELARCYGLNPEQMPGASNRALLGETAATLEAPVQQVFASGHGLRLHHELPTPEGIRLYDADYLPQRNEAGAITHVVMLARPLPADAAAPAEATHALAGMPDAAPLLRDAAGRGHSLEQVRLVHAAMESTSDALSIADIGGRTIYNNHAFIELYGYRVDMLNQRGGLAGICKDQQIAAHMLESIAQGRAWSGEVELLASDETLIPTLLRADSVLDETGNRIGFILACTDITRQKQAEQQLIAARESALEASRIKSEFLANMSHELRTPLNAIIGMTGLLLDTEMTEEQAEFAATVRSSSDTLLALINDILDFSKIEAGTIELEYQPFELRACVEEALDLVTAQAAQKHIELIQNFDPHNPEIIVSDVTRLRQVLVNLLNNAVKFTARGEVELIVQASHRAGNQYELHFAVRDTGIGIPTAHMNRLFLPFSQVDSSITRRHGGTGLGLVICKALVELMGGTIWAESEEDQGSTFHCTIVAEVFPMQKAPGEPYEQPYLSGKRVLIVDDNATNCRILERQVAGWGMHPYVTTSPIEALNWVQWAEPFDIAVLDMQMPEMDGLTLASRIRSMRPPQSLPLVLLTSIGGLRGVDTAPMSLSASLTKPVKPAHLHSVFLRIFAEYHQQHPTFVSVPPPPPPVSEPKATALPVQPPQRILLAEDNVINQKVALRMLQRLGHRADLAANGLEVLEAMARQSYDVVLMDVQMPDMDGAEATRHIRQGWTAEQQPYIIAMTADVYPNAREHYLQVGMDNYISKPVRLNELAEVLETFLQQEHAPPQRPLPAEATAPGEALPPAIDWQIFQELTGTLGNDSAAWQELQTLFLQGTPLLLHAMQQALHERNDTEVARNIHKLRSGCIQLGATVLANRCTQLEEVVRMGAWQAAPALLHQLHTEYERVRVTLQAMRHSHTTQSAPS